MLTIITILSLLNLALMILIIKVLISAYKHIEQKEKEFQRMKFNVKKLALTALGVTVAQLAIVPVVKSKLTNQLGE